MGGGGGKSPRNQRTLRNRDFSPAAFKNAEEKNVYEDIVMYTKQM